MASVKAPRAAVVVLAAATAVAVPAAEQRTTTTEDNIKAAFLLNFTRFVEWPQPMPAGPFRLCTVAEPAFNLALARIIAGETTEGRPIVQASPDAPAVARGCQMLFLSRMESAHAARWVDAVRGLPVLVVGETQAAADAGAAITFVVDDNRVKFDVNDQAAAGDGLKISSKLLRVARRVTPRGTR